MSAADHRHPNQGSDSRHLAPQPARTPFGLIGLFAALGGFSLFSAPAWPQWASVAQAPMSLATNPKPNVMFVLDNSGSMAWDYMPDDLERAPTHALLSAWCSGVAFDPTQTYDPPPRADGTSYGNATFTAAWNDGFAGSGSGTVNLSGSRYSTYYVFRDSTAPARDWRYDSNGAVDRSSDTYRYCMNESEAGRFEMRTVTATSDLAQKYANWYSYYRTRQLAMRTAAGKAMRGVGSEIRLGFTRISDTDSSGSWFLGVGEFSGTQRSNFYDLLYSSPTTGSTPLRRTLSRVGRYYAGTGSSAPIQYTCQRAYALLTTDGYWNSDTGQVYALDGRTQIGDADAEEPRPYNGRGASPSLADVAQYYYSIDLRPDLADELPPVAGDDAKGVLPDPNTRQHMNVFTLGLGLNGHLRPSDWPDLKSATGVKTWPVPSGTISDGWGDATHIDDLWHAAVNGRGQYYSASNPSAVAAAISDTFRRIGDISASAAAITSSTQTPVGADRWVFLPSYTSGTWSGDIKAYQYQLNPSTNTYTAPTMGSSTPVWSAAARLDARLSAGGDRDIRFNHNGSLAAFTYTHLADTGSAALHAAFDGRCSSASPRLSQCSTDEMMRETDRNLVTGDNLVQYLRGAGTYENDNTTATPLLFRGRRSALGDIVNAAPAYAGKPPFNYSDAGYSSYVSSQASRLKVVYAAANDGMLHAFQVEDSVDGSTTTPAGSELWAFVPTAVIPDLWKLADNSYSGNHRYFVDGTPVVADIYVSGQWRTILVGGLGAGGRSYYALDITNPKEPALLWEFGHFPHLVGKDYGKVIHKADMGLAMGNPVVTKNADGKWVVAFTSGVNNSNGINGDAGDGEGRLFVLDAFTGTLLSEVATGVGSPTAPSNLMKLNAWVASSSDNTALRFYAGDMQGNLWRFVPTYTGDGKSTAQRLARTSGRPITTKPALNEVATASGSIPVVSFGTGRYLGDPDVSDRSQQGIYSIKDTWSTSEGAGLEEDLTTAEGKARLTEITLSTDSTQTVDWSTKKGWYAELPTNQRVAINPTALGNGILAFVGTSPSADMCSGGGSSTLYQFNISSGKVTGMANYANPMIVGIERFDDGQGNIKAFLNFADQTGRQADSTGVAGSSTFTARRTSWRELTD